MATATVTLSKYTNVVFTYSTSNVDSVTSRFTVSSVVFNNTRSNGTTVAGTAYINVSVIPIASVKSIPKSTKTKNLSISDYTDDIRTHSGKTRTITFTVRFRTDDGETDMGNSVSVTWSIPAKSSWNVTYNANGGSAIASPNPDTKWYNEPLTLKAGNTLSGYTFAGWNTNNSGTGTDYAARGSYSANDSITLYSKWTRTVSYDANGGSNAPASQTGLKSAALTLTSAKPTRTSYRFLGWATSSSGSAVYQPGGSYPANNISRTLYATWGGMITSIHAQRCDGDGELQDEGTCMKLTVSWTKSPNASSAVPTLSLSVAPSVTTTMPTPTLSGTSGTYTAIIGSGNTGPFYSETRYTVTAVLADNITSHTVTTILDTAFYTIDFLAGGHGIAFGGASKEEGFDVNFNAVRLNNATPSTDSFYTAKNLTTNRSVSFGVGSGGVNAGLWDPGLSKWIIHSNGTNVVNVYDNGSGTYVNMLKQEATGTNAFSVYSGTATLVDASVLKFGRVVMVRIRYKLKSALSVPASGNVSNVTVGTIASGYCPAQWTGGYSVGDDAGAAWHSIAADGVVTLGACEGTGSARSISTDAVFVCTATYLTA